MDTFKIKTQVFEGPLDLLLSLIEKRKLLVNDISLAQVTDDYIAYLQGRGTSATSADGTPEAAAFPMAESANFILIASTLLLIKSKSLLPTLSLTEEEKGSIEDLEARLKMYQKIKELSLHVKERFGTAPIFAKTESKTVVPVFSPEPEITPPGVLAAIKEVIRNLPKKEFIPKAVVRKVMSLEEMIVSLTARIQSSIKMSFKDFAGVGKQERVHVIVSFLAMLELVKQGIVDVTQDAHFQDITIETQDVGVPRYN